MSNKNRNKKIVIGVFSQADLLKKASGKIGKHTGVVRSGTGRHKSKRDYTRKNKHQKRTRDYL